MSARPHVHPTTGCYNRPPRHRAVPKEAPVQTTTVTPWQRAVATAQYQAHRTGIRRAVRKINGAWHVCVAGTRESQVSFR
jgi:hypothetical protein